MTTLVLDRSNLEVRADGAALALYEGEERSGTVPLKLLERVVIQGNVRLDTGVLTKLAEAGIAILLLSKRQTRRVAIILGTAHNDAAIRLAQGRRVFDTAWCDAWARRQVIAKTRAQIRLLMDGLAARPDQRKPLTDAIARLHQALEGLAQEGIGSASIRGIEGAAARSYFQGLAALFPPALGFNGRNRRPPRDPVNACLSLGYTLLHFDAVRACHMAGLDPLLGFYHRPSFGRESLASDLIEPLRPHWDREVWSLFRGHVLRQDHFTQDKGACLLGKAGRAAFYRDHEFQAPPLRRLLLRQCRILARHLKAESESLLAQDEEEEFA
ncbi:MAG: CRISPR-associated endonuclease Cas1 [Gammaproteobacteria bacterium RIFOXYD12_FULL_61_37]|nr:MAG: CRISPR-associated endonuclease Cas1 [Gammaproteobacteria bacterium RIFOXYD12_FULL_61_37]